MIETERKGDWLQTFRGGQFWPMDPRAAEIFIEDIAHALSMLCRFGGHCRDFYCVAQHCVHVSQVVPRQHALWGLLHDASEAYLVDLPRPIKKHSAIGEHYSIAENLIQAEVCRRFGLSMTEQECVREADNILLLTEVRDLMAPSPVSWRASPFKPITQTITPWSPKEAEANFLEKFRELGGGYR